MPLVVFRIAFGALLLAGIIRFALKGWIHELYGAPQFHFTYYGFDWIRPLPPLGMHVVFVLMGLCALGVTLGVYYRFSISGFFLLFTYVELIDKSYYLNHYYLVSILSFLLLFLPAQRAFSIDAWRDPALQTKTVPAWTIWILRAQIGLVYFYAGLAKLKSDWLLHALPLKLWLPAHVDFPLIGFLFDSEWMAYAMSWGGAIFDLSIPFLLLWRRTRPLAFLLIIVFHGTTWLLFPIGIFPWLMIGSALIFFDWERGPFPRPLLPNSRQKLISRGGPLSGGPLSGDPFSGDPFSKIEKVTLTSYLPRPITATLLALFLIVQLLLPLRHHLYPGNLLWTEEGFRFAWHVLVYEKTGYAIFQITEPKSDRSFTIFPSDILTPKQQEQMAIQPDMIAQFARELARRYADPLGVEPVDLAVRAEAYVSLNGRTSRLLIDPTVDLTKVPNGIRPKTWIVEAQIR